MMCSLRELSSECFVASALMVRDLLEVAAGEHPRDPANDYSILSSVFLCRLRTQAFVELYWMVHGDELALEPL